MVFLAVVFLNFSCSESPKLPANNDPEKYTVAKDVLWASPNGFDLTIEAASFRPSLSCGFLNREMDSRCSPLGPHRRKYLGLDHLNLHRPHSVAPNLGLL